MRSRAACFKSTTLVRNGYTYLVKLPDGSVVAKEARWNGSVYELASINPKYEPIPLDNAEVQAVLVGWFRIRGFRETSDLDPDGLRYEPAPAYFAQNNSA